MVFFKKIILVTTVYEAACTIILTFSLDYTNQRPLSAFRTTGTKIVKKGKSGKKEIKSSPSFKTARHNAKDGKLAGNTSHNVA